MNSKIILVGGLAGVTLGVLTGMFWTSKKGVETRKKISQTGMDLTNTLKHKLGDFVNDVAAEFQSMNQKPNRLLEETKEEIEKLETGSYTLSLSLQVS